MTVDDVEMWSSQHMHPFESGLFIVGGSGRLPYDASHDPFYDLRAAALARQEIAKMRDDREVLLMRVAVANLGRSCATVPRGWMTVQL